MFSFRSVFVLLALAMPQNGAGEELSNKTTQELLETYVRIQDVLSQRGISRTGNQLTGNLGEYVFVTAFGWALAQNSQKGYDAFAGGVRYQIKARRLSKSAGTRQLGAIRDLDGFDFLAAVIFDRDYKVLLAALIPSEVVRQRSSYIAHTNSYRFIFSDEVLGLPDVIDVTTKLKELAY